MPTRKATELRESILDHYENISETQRLQMLWLTMIGLGTHDLSITCQETESGFHSSRSPHRDADSKNNP
jgi:hypothetical protein